MAKDLVLEKLMEKNNNPNKLIKKIDNFEKIFLIKTDRILFHLDNIRKNTILTWICINKIEGDINNIKKIFKIA